MNRSYQPKLAINSTDLKELGMKTAIHEAGHAAAIYFGNRDKGLPPVCFQILITRLKPTNQLSGVGQSGFAKIEGGRLIHTLPSSIAEATRDFSAIQQSAYLNAFDADMMNLLVGPLAEANYLALRDDEIINSRLVNMNSLAHYGGAADLQLVKDYLGCFHFDAVSCENKMREILAAAFHFINDGAHWRAIIGLANYIMANHQSVIECHDIIGLLDKLSRERKRVIA